MSEDEKWAVMVQEFKESRKSQRVWSSEKGIKRSTLRYWLERIEQLEIGTEICFAELIIAGDVEC